jgi:chemotaxis protein histidine kinase CheA
MSDEFIRVATKEVNDEIAAIDEILNSCKDDSDVFKKASLIEKHFHKIKGLAPMMGQNEIGEISAYLDKILKSIIDENKLSGVYDIFSESMNFMKNCMNGSKTNFQELKQKIKTNYAKILD